MSGWTAVRGSRYDYRRQGQLDRQMPGEKSDGTPYTDRGFANVPAPSGIVDLLDEILAA